MNNIITWYTLMTKYLVKIKYHVENHKTSIRR